MKISLLFLYGLMCVTWCIPVFTFASELRLDSSKNEVLVGEELIIHVIAHTDEMVNAIEGEVLFPEEAFVLQQVQDGDSRINFWLERPKKSESGVIRFSGITPGGFGGANQHIFSFILIASKEGVSPITLSNVRVLKNDGSGTSASFNLQATEVSVKGGDDGIRKIYITDTEPPEDFTPSIITIPDVFDGNHVLVFGTQDKGSGVAYFKVRENRWGWFRKAESPYVLKNQRLSSDIYIKAIDNNGNERIVVVPASVHRLWWERYELFVILILVLFVLLFYTKPWVRSIK